MMLIAFHTSHSLHTKGHSASEKTCSNFIKNFYFPNASILIKVLCNDCISFQLNKPYPNQKQIAEKQDFKGHSLYFNHRISFDTKGLISPSSEGNFYRMVLVDAFAHYEALNPVPHCNAYYAYTTLNEHWIAKFGLPQKPFYRYNFIDLVKKEIVQDRNNLLPYYPKEYALGKLPQLYSFTGLKVIQNISDHKQNQSFDLNSAQKPLERKEKELNKQTSKNLDNKMITQTERKVKNWKKKSYHKIKK